jgi:hypothetical protein
MPRLISTPNVNASHTRDANSAMLRAMSAPRHADRLQPLWPPLSDAQRKTLARAWLMRAVRVHLARLFDGDTMPATATAMRNLSAAADDDALGNTSKLLHDVARGKNLDASSVMSSDTSTAVSALVLVADDLSAGTDTLASLRGACINGLLVARSAGAGAVEEGAQRADCERLQAT